MLNISGRSTMPSEGWTPSHVKSSLSYDGVQAGRGKVHQTKPIDMVTEHCTNPCCYRIIINLLVDEGTSRDDCTIDWEGVSMGRLRSMHSDVKVAIFMNVFCISFKGRSEMDP